MPVIGVCSWSLQPTSPEDLAQKVKACGVRHVQIALQPLRTGEWPVEAFRETIQKHGLTVLSGMSQPTGEDYSTLESIKKTGGVKPDKTWVQNLKILMADAAIAKKLGIGLVTTHAGFLPEFRTDPDWAKMIERLRTVVDIFAAEGVRTAFETGQERAPGLANFLTDLNRPSVGVNFDPANMILYGMGDPVQSLDRLAPFVRQIHIKDAHPTKVPGTWGEEVPSGTGSVDWDGFFAVYKERGLAVDLAIEREWGNDRVTDIRNARQMLTNHVSF